MEAKLFWKSVIRRKGSLLLLWFLIAASTFGFMLRAVEYLAVHQEIERISREYRPIGSLTSPDWMVTEGAALVMESPYVELADVQRMCPVVLSDVYNADLDGYDDVFGDGKKDASEIMVWGTMIAEMKTDQPNVKLFDLRIDEGVYGYPEYLEPGTILQMKLEASEGEAESMPTIERGKSYLVRGYLPFDENIYRDEKEILEIFLLSLEEGVWFLEGNPDSETAQKYLPENFEHQERNRCTMMAFSTKDMTAMPLVQEVSRDFYLVDGRWITKQDNDEGNRVCVVPKEFAEIRGFAVGDFLTMTFQDRVLSNGYYVTTEEDTWESKDKTEETLEIVGIYGRMFGGQNNGYSSIYSMEFYVPDSCIPEHYAETEYIWGSLFSFMLADPREKDLFYQETEEELASLGISVTFVENNWDNFYKSAKSVEQGGFYSLVIFAVLLVLSMAAVTFLYTWQRRKECAIARALGVPAKRAAVCACLPLMVLGILGILAGGILAWRYGLIKAGETLAALESGGKAELSWFWLVGPLLLIWLMFVLALLIGNLFQARKQVLEVLQGRNVGRAINVISGKNKNDTGKTLKQEAEITGEWTALTGAGEAVEEKSVSIETGGRVSTFQHSMVTSTRGLSLAGMFRFIGRHLCRFSLRALFALLAVLGFLSASCWLWNAIQSGEEEAERLYLSTTVDAEITKKNSMTVVSDNGGAFIGGEAIQGILDIGFVKNYTLIAGAEGIIYKAEDEPAAFAEFIGITDVEKKLPEMGMEVEIQYGEGYGPELFAMDYSSTGDNGRRANTPFIILPEWMAEELDIAPGELLTMKDSDSSFDMSAELGGVYTEVTGGKTGAKVFAPLSVLKVFQGEGLYYRDAEFSLDPKKNRELEEFRQKGKEIIEAPGAGLVPLSLVIWDGELKQVVEPMEKNITLMKILYPLANTVAFLAAIGLSILFLFQRRREAAILRVMGVGTLLTRMVLTLELLAVDLVGILLGTGLVAFLTGAEGFSALPVAAGCYFLGCLIGAILGAVLVTRGRPLELLQGKE